MRTQSESVRQQVEQTEIGKGHAWSRCIKVDSSGSVFVIIGRKVKSSGDPLDLRDAICGISQIRSFTCPTSGGMHESTQTVMPQSSPGSPRNPNNDSVQPLQAQANASTGCANT